MAKKKTDKKKWAQDLPEAVKDLETKLTLSRKKKLSPPQERSWAEPYKIKMVEILRMTTSKEREKYIVEAGYNTFLLRARDVYIDLLTDSGTSAMSDRQWAGIMQGDEAYAGSENFYHMEAAVQKYYGYKYVVPTHQGRGAEHILSQLTIKKGDIVPGNMYFTTTKLHQELAGGKFADIIVDEAHDANSTHPFKGNVDLNKLQKIINEEGPEKIPYISLEGCVNMAGGQPFSLHNLKALRKLCSRHKIRIMLDATRIAENAFMIKKREKKYANHEISDILREICSLTDGATMSAKKDCLVNIGGFLALNDQELYKKACNMVVIYEGLHTYGGMAGRDMEALGIGIGESVNENHLRSRIGQTQYLGQKLLDYGVPIVVPVGGHAIYLNAKEILSHIPQDQFPAQTLTAELYVDSGIRAMERGIVSAGRNPETGDHNYPRLELVRLTIPRRVYTQAHMDVVAESVAVVFAKKDKIRGLKMTYEPKKLRFFQARFSKLRDG